MNKYAKIKRERFYLLYYKTILLLHIINNTTLEKKFLKPQYNQPHKYNNLAYTVN